MAKKEVFLWFSPGPWETFQKLFLVLQNLVPESAAVSCGFLLQCRDAFKVYSSQWIKRQKMIKVCEAANYIIVAAGIIFGIQKQNKRQGHR